MRLFGSERIAKLMDRMGLKEGEVIQHSMISKSIERAQRKVEENNFGVRKRLLEYDDVMNSQREVIYKRRKHALDGERLSVDINNMCYDTCQLLVSNHESEKNFNDFRIDILKTFAIDTNFNEDFFKNSSQEKIVEKLFENCIYEYKNKSDKIALTTFPVISNVFNDNTKKFENIVVPFTDGNKTLNVVTNLEEAFNSECHSLINSFEKNISLV